MSNRRTPKSSSSTTPAHPTRRDFLKGATAVAAGMLAAPNSATAETKPLPTIEFAGRQVTRLIAGGNPLYGYSHFNRLLDEIMREYFTDERVVQFLQNCEKAGINTWQSNFRDSARRHYAKARDAGVAMNWIYLADPWDVNDLAATPADFDAAMARTLQFARDAKPIAIAHHGVLTDRLFKMRRLDLVETFLKRAHDQGLFAGVSTHNPVIIEEIESKGWASDFYMGCFYRVTRESEEFRRQIGDEPVGESYLASDAAKMCKVLRQVRKPCLGFKILGAGRKCDSPQDVRAAFDFALKNLKPTDGVIVGMFPKFSDQIAENVGHVKALAT